MLSRTEEHILLAVWRLQQNAYGLTIRQLLEEMTGKRYSIGGIYVPLDRLAMKGLLSPRQGEPTRERGGMAKRYYTLTESGLKSLTETKRVHDKLWADLPGPVVAKT